jgi:hypothetical protein
VLDTYFELKEAQSLHPKNMLTLPSSLLCESAKALIQQEINNNLKSFDLQKIMDEMEE